MGENGPPQALAMLDHIDRARKMAASQGGVLDFEHAAAWIAEEWAFFVDQKAEKLPNHAQDKEEKRRPGPPGADRYRGNGNGNGHDRRHAGH